MMMGAAGPSPCWAVVVVVVSIPCGRALPCTSSSPLLVVYNRLPWFKSAEWFELVQNQSVGQVVEYQYTAPEKDGYTPRLAMLAADAMESHGDPLRVARTIREIQQRSQPRQRQRPQLLERSFSYLEVPDIPEGRVAWFNIVEDPIERSVRGFRGTASELDACVELREPCACVPCDTMTAWFCGGGPMCSTSKRGLAALVRAKLVLARDYVLVAVRERWVESFLVLEKLLPTYFEGATSDIARRLESGDKRSMRLDAGEPSRVAALKPETRKRIREANVLDVELYNHAVSHLEIIAYACLGRTSTKDAQHIPAAAAAAAAAATAAAAAAAAAQQPQQSKKRVESSLSALAEAVAPSATDGLAGHCVKRQSLHHTAAEQAARRRLGSDEDPRVQYCFPVGIGVGASRAGVGIVAAILSEHPRVRTPEKTLAYFGRATKRGRRGITSYLRNFAFSEKSAPRVGFEASPDYSLNVVALHEMRTLLGPRLKIVFALREPTARAYDDFWRYARAGRLYQRDRELFLCYERAFGADEPEQDSASLRQQRSVKMCASRGQRVPPRAVSPLVFDAYARQVVLDAWEPDLRSVARRASFNDSLPVDYEIGALNDNVFSKSFYAPQITRLLSIFDLKCLHLVVYEHLFSPARGPTALGNLGTFLGLSDHGGVFTADAISSVITTFQGSSHALDLPSPPAGTSLPAQPPYPPLLRKTRRLLEAFYTVDAELLVRMFPTLDLPW
ncbi:hypothetical protein CTAYLR_007040 [Chrysophaeum taylorii]|uniref:Sulfotransferase domain-containing protein n=1 Tax=Chrysophaeum taylorii TaxID=2483200 RepID=A0AAD7U8N1_9STRA|nr:hypothetical protein CTAYLR_007040 [Chrysophaeum taylorii]